VTDAVPQASVHRRFLVLTALRWLPVGLLIPVFVLLPLDRGLSLSEVGLAVSLQGVFVLALELPTGGLADAVGRRTVLLMAGVVGLASTGAALVAHTFWGFALAWALQGVYRALDSGPLEAWYVDASLAADPAARIDRGLSGAGVALGIAIGAGSLASGGVIAAGEALDGLWGLDPLALPLLVALALQALGLVAVALLMVEVRERAGARAVWRSASGAATMVADGIRLLRSSRVLLWVVLVEVCWGFGAATYETLFPIRLTEILDDAEQAAVVTGPTGAAAWLLAAAGAAATPWLIGWIGAARTAAALRVLHGVTVLAMGLIGGVVGVVTAYLACYAVHGAANPAHMTLLHRQVEGPMRATVISVNSMMAQSAGAVGIIVLTAVADASSAAVAIAAGAVVLLVAAPFYLPARRQEREREAAAEPVG
jgi:MFS family permease